MGFLYYFPGQLINDPRRFPQQQAAIERCGLVDVFRDSPIAYREVMNRGPDGGKGCICALGDMPDNFGYHADKQTWVEVKDASGSTTHWLGWTTLPKPDDLLRGKAPEGHLVEMGDGNKWLIPCVHAVSDTLVTLPQTMRMNADGTMTSKIVPGYEELITEGAWWWNLMYESGQYDWGRYWRYAVMLLSVCYRVSREEVNVLGLLKADTKHHHDVVFASLGVPDIMAQVEAQKKIAEQQDTSNSSHGEMAA